MNTHPTACVVPLVGNITHANSAEWHATIAVRLADSPALILEASGLHMLSSAGLRTLLLLHRDAAAAGKFFAIAGLPPAARDVMAVTGFLRNFAVFDSVEAACAAGEVSPP